jgi:hypothetical protein
LWRGTLEKFLINWQEQFRHYKRLVPAASHDKDEQKLAMLQVTVHPLRELRQVKNTALLIKQANSGEDLEYDKYVQLLAHAASNYDNIQIKAKGRRQVYIHDINEDNVDTYDEATSEYEPFDIDTPVDTIQAYAANYSPTSNRSGNNNQVQMPKDRWISLDDKTKVIRDSIEDKFKNIIFGSTTSSPHTSSYTPRHGKTPNTSFNKSSSKSRKAILHKFLQAFDNELEEAPEEVIADDFPLSADLEPDPPVNLLINSAKGSSPNPLPPGDIRRVMSKNSKRSIHMACIEYKVSYHKEHHGISPSLVDRGANGDIAGNNVCFIQNQLHH